MPHKVKLTFQKIKSKRKLTEMTKHDFRTDYCENVNKSLSHLNEVLVPMAEGQTYKTAFEEKIHESPYYRDHQVRKNAVLAIDVCLGLSRDVAQSPDFDLDKWKEKSVQWAIERFGKENVISAVLHRDEITPHIHVVAIPMHEQKLNCSHFIGGKETLWDMHDSYAKEMEEFGLERGQKYSPAKHENIQKFYAAIEEEKVKELPPVLEHETAEQYRERAQMTFRKANFQHLNEIKELKASASAAVGKDIEETIEQANIQKKYNEMLQRNEELEKENKVLKDKTKRLDEIAYAIRHNIPSEKAAQEFSENMRTMAKEARIQMTREEQEKAAKSIADDILDANK